MNQTEETPMSPDPAGQEQEIEQLVITEDIRSYIYESARWGKFLAIVGMVFSAGMVVTALGIGSQMTSFTSLMGPENPYAKMSSGFVSAWMILMAVIYFIPSFILWKYAASAKQAVLYGEQGSLSEAMAKMKAFFKFWGILTIVGLSFYAIVIVLVLLQLAA